MIYNDPTSEDVLSICMDLALKRAARAALYMSDTKIHD